MISSDLIASSPSQKVKTTLSYRMVLGWLWGGWGSVPLSTGKPLQGPANASCWYSGVPGSRFDFRTNRKILVGSARPLFLFLQIQLFSFRSLQAVRGRAITTADAGWLWFRTTQTIMIANAGHGGSLVQSLQMPIMCQAFDRYWVKKMDMVCALLEFSAQHGRQVNNHRIITEGTAENSATEWRRRCSENMSGRGWADELFRLGLPPWERHWSPAPQGQGRAQGGEEAGGSEAASGKSRPEGLEVGKTLLGFHESCSPWDSFK